MGELTSLSKHLLVMLKLDFLLLGNDGGGFKASLSLSFYLVPFFIAFDYNNGDTCIIILTLQL